jgi:hypothetical protein
MNGLMADSRSFLPLCWLTSHYHDAGLYILSLPMISWLRLILCLLLVGVVAQCDTQSGEDAPDATWKTIQADILEPNCTRACHVAGASFARQSDLVLTEDVAYAQLVDVPPQNAAARTDGLVRVATSGVDALERSYFWTKINAPAQEHLTKHFPAYGALMPLGGKPLTYGELAYIRQWILAGAPETGEVADRSLLQDTTRFDGNTFEPLAPPADGLQMRLGPFDVHPHFEREFFYYDTPNLSEDLLVDRIEVSMRPGSHHFILYTFPTSTQVLPPLQTYRELRNPDGSLNLGRFVEMQDHTFFSGTQWPRLDYRFPEGVALRLKAGQGFDMNAHYVNHADVPLQGEVHINLHRADPAQVQHEAQVLTMSNFSIVLLPGKTTTLRETFLVDRRSHLFQLVSHAHKHMTEFKVQVFGGPRDGETVYIAYDWEHPPILSLAPPLVLEPGQGLTLIATYRNDTDRAINFGFTSEDEMMILFGYYW